MKDQLWTRSTCLALSAPRCAQCHGSGSKDEGEQEPCECVLKAIFRLCLRRFRHHVETFCSQHGNGNFTKNAEYAADFLLLARRALNGRDWKLFRYVYLLGAGFELASHKLGMDPGNFFHAKYRVEKRLGRVFAETVPYSLYPVELYFHEQVNQGIPFGDRRPPVAPPGLEATRSPIEPRYEIVRRTSGRTPKAMAAAASGAA